MSNYDELMAFQRETEALAQIAGRLGWDQETMMPRGAAEQRGEEMGALETILHARRTDPQLGEWLEMVTPRDDVAKAQLREIRRSYERNVKVPARLASEIARVTSVSQGVWAEARANEDVAAFLPTLTEVLRLRREEAEALADGGDPYDALLDDYEPETTGAGIAALFDRMRPRLVALREAVLGAERQPAALTGHYPEAAQLRLSREVARIFGYDFTRGRLDLAVHPFSSGSGNDVRITTRVNEHDPFNCIYSTIHEVGHACYELGVDPDFLLTPLGRGASMGLHESQSRIYENQLGRSRAFTGWLYGRMQQAFDMAPGDAEAFYATVNRVEQGFIRTEADEVQYNLHIMLRFDLERALILGQLEVADLEEAWNERFLKDFGTRVTKPSDGLLQDVHWSVGLFGYFPTYTLGNVYAGCLHHALREALPDLDTALSEGRTAPATEWLRENVQRHGARLSPQEVVRQATGTDPSEEPLLIYLEAKFGELYGI